MQGGIGTTTPNSALDVRGITPSIRVSDNGGTSASFIGNSGNDFDIAANFSPTSFVYTDNSKTAAKMTISTPAAPAFSNFTFYSTNANNSGLTARMRISDGVALGSYSSTDAGVDNLIVPGNVGIGTTSPVTSLDLGSKTDAVRLPAGTTGQRPGTPVNGDIRYNSSNNKMEAYENGAWANMISSATGTVSGTTGKIAKFTGATAVGDSIITEASSALSVAANSASTGLAVTQSGAGYAATFMGGNVGIGTTAPSSLISAYKASGAATMAINVAGASGDTANIDILTKSDSSSSLGTATNTKGWRFEGIGDATAVTGNTLNYKYFDGTSWTTAMTSKTDGSLNMQSHKITGLPSGAATTSGDAVEFDQLAGVAGGISGYYVKKVGDTMTGPLVNNTSSASTALAITQSGAGYAATFMGGNVGIGEQLLE
jgi:hypothetical protein